MLEFPSNSKYGRVFTEPLESESHIGFGLELPGDLNKATTLVLPFLECDTNRGGLWEFDVVKLFDKFVADLKNNLVTSTMYTENVYTPVAQRRTFEDSHYRICFKLNRQGYNQSDDSFIEIPQIDVVCPYAVFCKDLYNKLQSSNEFCNALNIVGVSPNQFTLKFKTSNVVDGLRICIACMKRAFNDIGFYYDIDTPLEAYLNTQSNMFKVITALGIWLMKETNMSFKGVLNASLALAMDNATDYLVYPLVSQEHEAQTPSSTLDVTSVQPNLNNADTQADSGSTEAQPISNTQGTLTNTPVPTKEGEFVCTYYQNTLCMLKGYDGSKQCIGPETLCELIKEGKVNVLNMYIDNKGDLRIND